jgi:hypothetical protein
MCHGIYNTSPLNQSVNALYGNHRLFLKLFKGNKYTTLEKYRNDKL